MYSCTFILDISKMNMYLEFDILKKNQNFIMKKGGYKTQLCFPENP